MKRTWLIGLVLLFAGCAVFTAGFFGAGRDLSAVNGTLGPFGVRFGRSRGFGGDQDGTAGYDTQTYDYEPMDIRRVELLTDNGNVILTRSPDAWVHLISEESDAVQYKITHSGNTLTVICRERAGILFGLWDDALNLELQLPEKHQCTVRAASANGDVTADGLWLHWQDSGAELRSDNGKVAAAGLTAQDVVLNSSNGTVTADGVECTGAELHSDNGRVLAKGIGCETLTAVSRNGSVELARVMAESVSAESGNGSVALTEWVDAASVALRSDNGSIRGTLAGSLADYTVRSGTGNGKNSLPGERDGGSRRLEVFTENGSIDLRFREDG